MTINVIIVVIVVNAAATVVMSVIVITITLKRVIIVVVVGRIVDTVIIGVIIIISITSIIIIIMNAISMTVTPVCASVVNRKKKFGRSAAIRTTASSRGATAPVDFRRRANVGSEPVAPAQKTARDDDFMRFLMSESRTVLQRCVDVLPEGGRPQWICKRVERFAIIRRCHLKI